MAIDKSPIRIQTFQESPTVREFAAFFMENYATALRNKFSERVSKKQILDGYLLPMFGDFRLHEITNIHIDVFIRRMAEAGAAPKSINNRLAVLSKLLRYAQKRKLLDNVPAWEPVKPAAVKVRFLSVEECRDLQEAALEHGPFWSAMVVLGLHTGMRSGELRALKWSDIKGGIVKVQRAVWRNVVSEPKTAAGIRDIPLNEASTEALKLLLPIGPFIFGQAKRKHLVAHETARKRLLRITTAAGIRGCGWHTLRHTFASHLVMAGVPLRTVQGLMGHATIQMTMRYSHLSPEAKSTATDILSALFQK